MPYGTINADKIASSNSGSISPDSSVFRNRIINGAMVIDQRNAGASVTQTASSLYVVDRFFILGSVASKFTAQQNAGSVTPPVGFSYYLGMTSSSAYSVGSSDYFICRQTIEGFNTADLGWGTVNAKTVTLSFQVYSSLTGTFGGCIQNSAVTRNYPFTYTISSANTWTTISVTIAGDTSGTWVGATNAASMYVTFSLGAGSTYTTTAGAWTATASVQGTGATSVVGTNGATFYITGVQLEKGSTATSFDYRPYSTELALCQRYYEKSYSISVVPATNTAFGTVSLFTSSTPNGYLVGSRGFAVSKRDTPVITIYSPSGTAGTVADGNTTNYGTGQANQIATSGFGLQNISGANYAPAGNLIYFHFVAVSEL